MSLIPLLYKKRAQKARDFQFEIMVGYDKLAKMEGEKKSKVAVLFIPETGIYPFARSLAVLGDALKKAGHDVFITGYPEQMPRSLMAAKYKMPASIPAEQKTKFRIKCEEKTRAIKKLYGFSVIDPSEFVTAGLLKEVEDLVEKAEDDLEKITYRGFQAGKVSLYDIILETKSLYHRDSPPEHTAIYKEYIKNAALTLAITEEICRRYQPALFLAPNQYAESQAVKYGAQKHGARCWFVSHPVNFNVDASKFMFWGPDSYEIFACRHTQKWAAEKDSPIPASRVKECWDDTAFRLFGAGGSHIFSNKKGADLSVLSKKLGLNPNKKTIVAYTSSYDEQYASEALMEVWQEESGFKNSFVDQAEWLSMLKDWAAGREDVQIVARIHPREGSRRAGFASEHFKKLQKIFNGSYKNFTIIWPDDPTSSYDLLELADLCLVSWSSVAQEAARLGIPALASTANMIYPDDDFIQTAGSREEYQSKLELLTGFKYSWEHLVKAIRLYHWRTFVPILDLGESVPIDFKDESVWPEAPAAMTEEINSVLWGQKTAADCNIKKWKNSLTDASATEEKEAVRRGVRYILDKFFYPPSASKPNFITGFQKKLLGKLVLLWRRIYRQTKYPSKRKDYDFQDYDLQYSTDISRLEELRKKTESNKKLRIILADGLYSNLLHNGKIIRKMSPMCNNLARLYHESEQ